MRLSEIQEEIVNLSGNLIVRASAGTGKTYTMVNKIAREIENNHTHKVIAAITFTIKAAQEIKERLHIDDYNHFIGTNNSFVIEEIIKPFMKDVYGYDYDIDMSTDYSTKVDDFNNALKKIRNEGLLCSYKNVKKNFIFELAGIIVTKSRACRLYLKSKYFKIYIDEYQDCDAYMHNFFMYLCDTLGIETFVVGDEKQSIYIWRGAYPEAFKSIWNKTNFKKRFMGDNFRSCQQIQNYSNLLYKETRHLYRPTKKLDNIVWVNTNTSDWISKVLPHIDTEKKSALLRFSNDNSRLGADELSKNGLNFVYIPLTPISDITTETAWLYSAIAKYLILDRYSVYDLISEIPAEGDDNKKVVSVIKKLLENIEHSIGNENNFYNCVNNLVNYLGYEAREDHLEKLYLTVINDMYHVSFETDKYQHIAITFHSSKGLEFDQVILFANDYNLNDDSSFCNHYVAATRAKNKLIIVYTDDYYAQSFKKNLNLEFNKSGLSIDNLVEQYW